jgi:predicted GNAT family acetyltransferase
LPLANIHWNSYTSMPSLTIHTTADDFLSVAQAELARAEVANGLILGVPLRLQAHPERIDSPPFLATVQDETGLAAAAMMTPPYHLVVYNGRPDPAPAFTLVAQALLKRNWQPGGVNGPAPASEQFAACWQQITGQRAYVLMRLAAFELRQVIPPPVPAPGEMRTATLDDLPLVERWMDEFTAEAIPEELGRRRPDAARRSVEECNIVLWVDGGEPVSLASRARPLLHGVTVNMVYTPPALRGRGYASACVAALSQRLLDQGWHYCTLFTDLANPISNSIYQRIGYQRVCDYVDYAFE